MTAEIAILNTTGIALAADSAVTLEIPSGTSNKRKIYNGTNKLFTLSKFHPVGIMVFGNATLLGLPWEVIIKNYRSKLWKKEFDKLSDYADDFRKYLEHVLPEDEQQQYFKHHLSSYFQIICQDIIKEVADLTNNGVKIPLTKVKLVVAHNIKNHLDQLGNRITLSGIPESFDKRVVNNRKGVIDGIIKDIFINLPITKTSNASLHKIAGLLFIKDIFPQDISGVVVAGYGKIENFPSLIQLTIDGVIDNVVKLKEEQKVEVSYKNEAIIVPFAQDEMVRTFMEGVNPNYKEMVNSALTDLLHRYPQNILDNIAQISESEKGEILDALIKIGEEISDDIMREFDVYRDREFISPVISAVGALPKDELAVMAETLVNLTSFKRKMSLDAETVGGPIDVAVISKGDGFVWIKRKHYFNAELNHHFFKNYYICAEKEVS